ncbi:hypothetical protein [Micromonospora parastrephiae]|uniref:hypothetical protein n=1 Tax=Micromonospora parastrephiae TaxID=2806101 RepID=UPI001EE3FB10
MRSTTRRPSGALAAPVTTPRPRNENGLLVELDGRTTWPAESSGVVAPGRSAVVGAYRTAVPLPPLVMISGRPSLSSSNASASCGRSGYVIRCSTGSSAPGASRHRAIVSRVRSLSPMSATQTVPSRPIARSSVSRGRDG